MHALRLCAAALLAASCTRPAPALVTPASQDASSVSAHSHGPLALGALHDAATSPKAHVTPVDPGAPAWKPASALLGQILHDNAIFVREHASDYFQPFQEGQHPRATVVACADSRFHLQAIDAAPDGDIFEIRNIGNQVDGSQGSVEYGVHHLHTPLLLIIGHVGCGAVKAALSDYAEEPAPIRRELDGLHLSLKHVLETKAPPEQQWLAGVLANVHQQVADAMQEYAASVRAGELIVVGAVYDFRGDLGEARGKLHLINVNGEVDPERLRASPLLKEAARLAQGG